MRSYIFTEAEVDRLLRWLRTGEEDDATRMIFVGIRRDLRRLVVQLDLAMLVMRELRRQRRWGRRLRLPREMGEKVDALVAMMRALRTR